MSSDSQRYAVIGLGRFGEKLARTLAAAGAEVIAVDKDARPVEALRDEVTVAVRLDSTDVESLRTQGVEHVDVAIVGIGENFESAALTVAALREVGVKRIIARAMTDIQGRILLRVGADEIAQPENESATRWSHRLMLPSLTQYVELGENHSMIYRTPPVSFVDKELRELDLRNQYGVNLVAIEREVGEDAPDDEAEKDAAPPDRTVEIPRAATKIRRSDTLVLIGTNDSLAQLPRD